MIERITGWLATFPDSDFFLPAIIAAAVVLPIIGAVNLYRRHHTAPRDVVEKCCAWESYEATCSESGYGISLKGEFSLMSVDVPCVKKRCVMYVLNFKQPDGSYTARHCPEAAP